MKNRLATLPVLLLSLLLVPVALAQPAAEDELLGERFESQTNGITFRPPAELLRVPADLGEVARYVHPDGPTQGRFVVSRIELQGEGMPLRNLDLPALNDQKAVRRPGLLEATAEQLLKDTPGTLHRKDTVYVNNVEVGTFILEQAAPSGRRLAQVGLVRVSDRIYFRLLHVKPLPEDVPLTDAPEARRAAEVFAAMLDSVSLVDRSDLRAQQEDWLINTRNLLVHWDEQRVTDALVPMRWLRVREAGRDVGYMVLVEERADDLPSPTGGPAPGESVSGDGVRIGVRSLRKSPDGTITEREQWSYFNLSDRDQPDARPEGARGPSGWTRDNERWNILTATRAPGAEPVYAVELGHSQRRNRVVADPFAGGEENPGVAMQQTYKLQSTRERPNNTGQITTTEEVERDLPAFYQPQALAHLAPRLLPLGRPRTYMMAQWVPAQQEVMARYLEVTPRRDVELAGRTVEAVTVKDRLGLDGIATEHYFDPAGNYLGSRTPEARLEVTPITEEELAELWVGENIGAPAPMANE
jgi:hypothetical protein